ncbi:MAG: protein serine/threonine phosphatase [Bacteroidetes bacterium]|nr:MAG: protein serine/threonine phosphatase [Bacteroidota bacterium]
MNNRLKELNEKLEQAQTAEERVDALNGLAAEYRFSDIHKAKETALQSLELARQEDYALGEAASRRLIGAICEVQGDYLAALEHLQRAAELYTGHEIYSAESIITNNQIAKVYANLGDYVRGLEFLFQSLRTAQEKKQLKAEANTLNSMSVLYQRMNNAQKAEECARQCLQISEQTGEKRILGVARVNLGNAYGLMKNWERALDQWEISLTIFEAMGDADLQSSTLGNLGIACQNLGQYEKAESYLLQCMDIKEKSGNRYDVLRALQNLASVNCEMKRFGKALEYCDRAMEIDAEIKVKSMTYLLWREKALIYKGMGDFEKALDCFEKYHTLEKELFTEEAGIKTQNLQARFEMEKSEKEKEIYRLRNIDLAAANEQITRQKEEIEQANKDITDSIRYAKRIQGALLPTSETMKRLLPDAFVFYRPRDIVSGDFYWVAEAGGKLFVAVADCTGHGVPGALLSVIGNNLFEQAVHKKKLSDPAEVLNDVSREMQELFRRGGDESSLNDGMDVALCRISEDKKEILFAGANNAAYIVRANELIEMQPDKQPVGLHGGDSQSFSTRCMNLQPGDNIYLGTDGFADQFGGPKGKKFRSRQVQEMLVSNSEFSMNEQLARTAKIFDTWKGDLGQTDDVCIIGIRV